MKPATYLPVDNVTASDGQVFAYRRLGPTEGLPLVIQTHLRGHMGFWDPILVRTLASQRQVIMFDLPGIGESPGDEDVVPESLWDWADNMNKFMDALELDKVDLFLFSIGSFTGQLAYLAKPERVRRMVLVGSDPGGIFEKDQEWPRTVPPKETFQPLIDAETDDECIDAIGRLFFWTDGKGIKARDRYFERVRHSEFNKHAIKGELPKLVPKDKLSHQIAAVLNWWEPRKENTYYRLADFKIPTLIINGDNDIMVPHARSWELTMGIAHAQLIILPHAGHGSLNQYPKTVGDYTNSFLNSNPDDWDAAEL